MTQPDYKAERPSPTLTALVLGNNDASSIDTAIKVG